MVYNVFMSWLNAANTWNTNSTSGDCKESSEYLHRILSVSCRFQAVIENMDTNNLPEWKFWIRNSSIFPIDERYQCEKNRQIDTICSQGFTIITDLLMNADKSVWFLPINSYSLTKDYYIEIIPVWQQFFCKAILEGRHMHWDNKIIHMRIRARTNCVLFIFEKVHVDWWRL